MDKERAREILNSLGKPQRMQLTSAWKEAYHLYNEHSGKRVKLYCSTCARKVYNWLASVCK